MKSILIMGLWCPAVFALALSTPPIARAAQGLTETVNQQGPEEHYEALIGNHESVKVHLDANKNGDERITVSRQGFSSLLTYTLSNSTPHQILIEEASSDGSGHHQSIVTSEDPSFHAALVHMRDLVAYTAAPDRFTWNMVDDEDLLKPDLQRVVSDLDTQIAAIGPLDVNCKILGEPTSLEGDATGGRREWSMTAGMAGDLGLWDKKALHIWVRTGYVMILMEDPAYSKEHGYLLVNSGRRDSFVTPSQDGIIAHLDQQGWAGRVSSVICVPDSTRL